MYSDRERGKIRRSQAGMTTQESQLTVVKEEEREWNTEWSADSDKLDTRDGVEESVDNIGEYDGENVREHKVATIFPRSQETLNFATTVEEKNTRKEQLHRLLIC